MRYSRSLRAVGLGVLGGFLLASCASADDEEQTAAGEESSAQENASDPDATLNYAYTIGPGNFDPHRNPSDWYLTALNITYDRLVHTDADMEPVPGLATAWRFGEDDAYLEMDIRKDVTFHDGTELDAEAVKANIERALTLEGSTVASQIDSIEEAEVMDDHTVRLHLDGPGGHLPLALSGRPGMMVSPAAFDRDDLDRNPAGAGMFTVEEWRDGDIIRYAAYDDYWDETAVRVAGIDFHMMPDATTRFNALRDGTLDLTFLLPHQREEAEAAGFMVETRPTLAYHVLSMNRSREPLDDPRVRRAINHALDREEMVEALLYGQGEPASQPFPEDYWAANPDIPPDHFDHDPDLARELLTEAGLEDGFSMSVIQSANQDLFIQYAEVIQAQLAEVGIDVELRPMEAAQSADAFLVQQSADASMTARPGSPDPSIALGELYTPGFSNPGDHTTDELQRLHEQSLEATDPAERKEVLHRLVAESVEEAMDVPLTFDLQANVYHDRVVGFEVRVSRTPEFRGVAILASE